MKDYYIVISSNRPAQQIVNHLNKVSDLKFEIFNKDFGKNMYWNKDDIVGVTNEKPVGILYVDDRAFRYNNLQDLQQFIEEAVNGKD